MPTYEYECQKCKKVFEVFQGIKEKPLLSCPDKNCRGKVKRLISSGGGFIFKGTGFYATDYRSDNYRKKAKEESPDSSPCKNCDKREGGCKVDK